MTLGTNTSVNPDSPIVQHRQPEEATLTTITPDLDNLVAHARELRSANPATNKYVEPFMAKVMGKLITSKGLVWGIRIEGSNRIFAYAPSDVDRLMFASGGGYFGGGITIQVSSDRIVGEARA